MGKDTIRRHPENSKIFQFRGKPVVLVCATEHYGSVMNRPFNFERYLADAKAKSQTLTRLFTLFRELQDCVNPYSPCKPESPDYISPFKRIGPGNALDGQPKYDLGQWNPEFFDRLHRFLSMSGEYGIIVELVFFSNAYTPQVWALNPLNAKNNVNGLDDLNFYDFTSMRDAKLFEWQCAYVQKMIEEVNKYDHIIYEICNEPGSENHSNSSSPTQDEVNDWQCAIANLVRRREAKLPNQHLIAGSQAWRWPCEPYLMGQFEIQSSNLSFGDFPVDIVNIHPMPDTKYGGKLYDLGPLFSKKLFLRAMRDFCLDTYSESKPLNMDEDNISSQYKDIDSWTIHRKRAWMTLLCGGHYDYIDFSIINYCETGTAESQRCIRSWMKHLSEFIQSIDMVRARPLRNFLRQQPELTVEAVVGVENKDYCIYLADERELDQSGAGGKIKGEIVLDLLKGNYEIACFSPVTGLYSLWISLAGDENIHLGLPEFNHDIVLRIRRLN